MSEKYSRVPFYELDITDPFFHSLIADYPEFPSWFQKKSDGGESAFVFKDETGISTLIYLKDENETIELQGRVLPKKQRIKIGTLKLDSRVQGQRLGEGAIGIALWKWQEDNVEEIYVTIFPKHKLLIELLEKFGFQCIGQNERGELLLLKDRDNLDVTDPYKAFPYIYGNFEKAGYIPVFDNYHDMLFPFSELYRTNQEVEETAAANGITKIYIGSPYSKLHHKPGEPAIIYRIHQGSQKQYKSAVTSFCTITNITDIKLNGRIFKTIEEYLALAGNKTIFTREELEEKYYTNSNLVVVEMVYNGFFGKGNNVIYKVLKELGLFNDYPYNVQLTKEQFELILRMGGKNVQHIIAD